MSAACHGISWERIFGRSHQGDAVTSFPSAYWAAWNADATFLPGTAFPEDSVEPLYAVLVFLYFGSKTVLADIAGRGLCIPSGRIEPGETPGQAAEREVWEETGAWLGQCRLIGSYRLDGRDLEGRVRWCPVYVAEADHFKAIPAGSESQGVFLASPAELPELYFTWDPLIAAVFAYAEANRA